MLAGRLARRRPRKRNICRTPCSAAARSAACSHFRSQSLDPAQANLGAIATSFAAQLNEQNALGVDLNGNAGGALFSTGSPTVYANSQNTGNASLTCRIADATQPPTGDYTLGLNGTTYTLTDQLVGRSRRQFTTAPSTGAVSGTIAGMNISLTTGIDEGRRFVHDPADARRAPALLAHTTNPSAIAAASPAVASAATGNTGTGKISAATVTAGYSIPTTSMTLTYDAHRQAIDVESPSHAAGQHDRSGRHRVRLRPHQGPRPYPTAADVSATINGTPSNGDSFTIAANTGGTSDGSNALAMANLGTAKSMNGGTDTLTSAYANYVNQIGNETNQLQSIEHVGDRGADAGDIGAAVGVRREPE